MEGEGEMIWKDDKREGKFLRNRYYGEWKEGKRHGFGVFYYANGSRFEGFWEANKKQGQALFYNDSGKLQKCLFNNDRLQAKHWISSPYAMKLVASRDPEILFFKRGS